MVRNTGHSALAIDLGSSSGKAVLGYLQDGVINTVLVQRIKHRMLYDENWGYHWDVEAILAGIRETIEKVKTGDYVFPTSISVDTWGVDYALIDKAGHLLAKPHAYRDTRTEKVKEAFYSRLSPLDLFDRTGVQPQDINTVLQLMADNQLFPEIMAQVDKVLMLPDFFLYILSGQKGWSPGICSSSALASTQTREWCKDVLSAAGLPESWFGTITDEIQVLGMAKSEFQLDSTHDLQVIKAGSHDTACAINALPVDASENPYFISCGSWSLAGVCTPAPVTSLLAFAAGLTNETRADGGNRLLKNMSGMWIFQECIRHWEKTGISVSYAQLDAGALEVEDIDFIIDPGDESLMGPDNMPRKIYDLVVKAHGIEQANKLTSPAAYTRLINQSLAVAHAHTMRDLQEIAGIPIGTIYMMGGGINNKALCQYTADATGKIVVAGPEEASAIGNILAQLQAQGAITKAERKDIVKASFKPTTYHPDPNSKLLKLLN